MVTLILIGCVLALYGYAIWRRIRPWSLHVPSKFDDLGTIRH